MDENETPSTTPLPTITSFYDKETGQEYAIEDPVARKRAEENSSSVSYEVGDLFFSMNPTSPAARFGGEWEQLTNVFLRAADDTETGGSDTISLTSAQLPEITGEFLCRAAGNASSRFQNILQATGVFSSTSGYSTTSLVLGSAQYNSDGVTLSVGSGETHSIMPAYQNVYAWKRVA